MPLGAAGLQSQPDLSYATPPPLAVEAGASPARPGDPARARGSDLSVVRARRHRRTPADRGDARASPAHDRVAYERGPGRAERWRAELCALPHPRAQGCEGPEGLGREQNVQTSPG